MSQLLYVCFILNFYLFISVECIEPEDKFVKTFIKSPDESPYALGSTVTLSCGIEFNNRTKIVVFRKEKSMKSEGCRVFDGDKYDIKCTGNDKTFQDIQFIIKKISWEDRGKWECFYSQNIKSIELDILVNPLFDKLQVNAVQPVVSVTEKIDESNTRPYRLMGRGSRTNPYNLRDGATVNITCLSSCSYPETIHQWQYKNSTHNEMEIKVTRQKKRDLCNLDSNKGMIASESEVTINCSSQKIVGANIVTCGSRNHSDGIASTSVYILCPGGERPWELTTGEIVGVAVSVGISILLVVCICLLVKRSRYTSVPGDVSTNTYSSGVKV